MAREQYIAQLQLLVQTLPAVADERVFALKGGTAINLFYRDLPRLSVDIDLTYLPIKPRDESLAEIDQALDSIAAKVEKIDGVRAIRIAGGGGGDTRVEIRRGNTAIKVETSPVARGTVHPVERRRVSERSRTSSALPKCRSCLSRISSVARCMPQSTDSTHAICSTSGCFTKMRE